MHDDNGQSALARCLFKTVEVVATVLVAGVIAAVGSAAILLFIGWMVFG